MTTFLESDIIRLNPLIKNFRTRTSAFFSNKFVQILCLVSESDDILLWCIKKAKGRKSAEPKLILWFSRNNYVIRDVCFDPTGVWISVICHDNTLHIIPVLYVFNDTVENECPFAKNQITSFQISNLNEHTESTDNIQKKNYHSRIEIKSNIDELDGWNKVYSNFFSDMNNAEYLFNAQNNNCDEKSTVERNNNHNVDKSVSFNSRVPDDRNPNRVTWWKTFGGNDRAIISYMNGSLLFVDLCNNCSFINNSCKFEDGYVTRMDICIDNKLHNVDLLMNISNGSQYRLNLENSSSNFIFPGSQQTTVLNIIGSKSSSSNFEVITNTENNLNTDAYQEWQIIPSNEANKEISVGDVSHVLATPDGQLSCNNVSNQPSSVRNIGLLPAARSRFATLKQITAKKIDALKMIMSESKQEKNLSEKGRIEEHDSIINEPNTHPQVLSTSFVHHFVIQHFEDVTKLAAVNSTTNTLSLHAMDSNFNPEWIYKIPDNTIDVLLTKHLIFTLNKASESSTDNAEFISDSDNQNHSTINVISCKLSSLVIGSDPEFSNEALLGRFNFKHEHIVGFYKFMPCYGDNSISNSKKDCEKDSNYDCKDKIDETIKLYIGEMNIEESGIFKNDCDLACIECCLLVTNENVYCIQLCEDPIALFIKLVQSNSMEMCEQFCKIFSLDLSESIEFVADELLKQNRVEDALRGYSMTKIRYIKTALKLAMSRENKALMKLCAVALKCSHILNSEFASSRHINILLESIRYRTGDPHIYENMLEKCALDSDNSNLTGIHRSSMTYAKQIHSHESDMSNSSYFHLSNLLLLTLSEVAIKEKDWLPLWNFLTSNKQYHVNITSIVLCKSGLYAAAILLAIARGCHLNVYCGLVNQFNQQFAWYTESNFIIYNLADVMFRESIIFVSKMSIEYFKTIQTHICSFTTNILQRLMVQLDPFCPVFRPAVSRLSTNFPEKFYMDSNKLTEFFEFSKLLIETYIVVILKLYKYMETVDNWLAGINRIDVQYEFNEFALKVKNYIPVSAGYSHCACSIDGAVYIWGTVGGNSFISNNVNETTEPTGKPSIIRHFYNMGLEVHAVKCGRAHTLFLTNNGLYAMGGNQLGQLGVGDHLSIALDPVLVLTFNNKIISHLEVGQYHCAVVADDELYTWGWGIYGQLGHGNIENYFLPKLVKFFQGKKIKQISLGHSHSLVLCTDCADESRYKLYAFGSNHVGQLGIGKSPEFLLVSDDYVYAKCLRPIAILLSYNIRMINTKYFTNFAVTIENNILTWGSSPQELRLISQARKRSKLTQSSSYLDPNHVAKCSDPTMDTDEHQHQSVENMNINSSSKEYFEKCNIVVTINAPVNYNAAESTQKLSTSVVYEVDETPSEKSSCNNNKREGDDKIISVMEEVYQDHLSPTIVDTSEVNGTILQIASGLYHAALLTDQAMVYTWGKNFEKQLGREGKNISVPGILEDVDEISFVECGADFTILVTKNLELKAFGNNSCGQCARDCPSTSNQANSLTGKLVRLRLSKRLVRLPYGSQSIDRPIKIDLPRPEIPMDSTAIRYLKSIPPFNSKYIIQNKLLEMSQHISENESIISITDPHVGAEHIHPSNDINDNGNDHNNQKQSNWYADTSNAPLTNDFIHYCLYVFNGIYDADKFLELPIISLEFKIRILMQNYRYKDAFKICISNTRNVEDSIKIFEYFTKDTNVVPILREDITVIVHDFLTYIIEQQFSVVYVEEFLIAGIDYYLLSLAYVLFFNNNNIDNNNLEKEVLCKYADVFGYSTDCFIHLENTELIFNNMSTKFKTSICQRLNQFGNSNI